MAMISEAVLGAIFGELLKAVFENIYKAVEFRTTLENLQSILIVIAPMIEEIEKRNNELGHSKDELELLMRQMKEGTELVYKCSKIRKRDFLVKPHYKKQLEELAKRLVTHFNINMQAQIVRDQKDILIDIRRILDALKILPIHDAINCPTSSSDSNRLRVGNSPIIGPQEYCRSSTTMLNIVRTVNKLRFSDTFQVIDNDNQIIFNLQKSSLSVHQRCTLFDNKGNPIITLHRRRKSVHNRWQVFRGGSEETEDLVFNVKREHMVNQQTTLDVFLAANNSGEQYSDFKVKGNWSGRSYFVHAGLSNDPIAEVTKYIAPAPNGSDIQGVVVWVQPNVDLVFIVALSIVILSIK